MRRPRRSTPPGEHRPVLLNAVLDALAPKPGEVAVDCTVGAAGHSAEILQRLGPEGLLIGLDWDIDNLPQARARLTAVGNPFVLEHANFAGLLQVLEKHGRPRVDLLVADLGMSSMQVDDPQRGFSYRRDGPLDMRMDRTRGRTAAQLLATISEADLAQALAELGDEEQAAAIAAAIVAARQKTPLLRTAQLGEIIVAATKREHWRLHPSSKTWNLHPAARTFQALRLLVNRELGNLHNLLRVLPEVLAPRGRAAIISFHSGEDRLVKAALTEGRRREVYERVSAEPIRPGPQEQVQNPRSRSAKLRWAVRMNM